MSTMYERIKDLCDQNKISVSEMCRRLSITRSCLSELSRGRTETLSAANTSKIAGFFGVSTDYLVTGRRSNEKISRNDLKFALFGSADIDDEVLEDVERYAEIVKRMREEKGKK